MNRRLRYKCEICGRELLNPIDCEPLFCCGQKMKIISNNYFFDKSYNHSFNFDDKKLNCDNKPDILNSKENLDSFIKSKF